MRIYIINVTKFSNLSRWFNLFRGFIMKFVNIVENGITKVILDLEALHLQEYEPNSTDTVCTFERTIDFDFSIINEFLSRLDAPKLRTIATTLIMMRRYIALYGHVDPAADEYVGNLRHLMQKLFNRTYPTGSVFEELYSYSKEFVSEANKVEGYPTIRREMFITASLLSALCVMVIHDFETHFTDVYDPCRVLYPVFEEAIRDCGIDGAKEFVEGYRTLVSNMDDDRASWVIEGIYINDCMLRKHKLPSSIEKAVIEHLTQRILSSKSYHSNKRMREMREINKAEEQQRMKNNKMSVTPLTDEEFKEFSKKIEHGKLLPVREILKDTLDVIQFTVEYFIRHDTLIQGTKDIDTFTDVVNLATSNAKSRVDEMDDNELSKIAKHANYVQDAFNLVRIYIPASMYQCGSQPIMYCEIPGLTAVLGARKLRGYLRKVLDICNILNTPAKQYMGTNIVYFPKMQFEELLSKSSNVKGTTRRIQDELGYKIYNTELHYPYWVHPNEQPLDKVIGDPDIFLKWTDENAKNINKDEFFEFLTRRESEISAYTKLKQSYPNLTADEKDEICKVFYRWFLKEQVDE